MQTFASIAGVFQGCQKLCLAPVNLNGMEAHTTKGDGPGGQHRSHITQSGDVIPIDARVGMGYDHLSSHSWRHCALLDIIPP